MNAIAMQNISFGYRKNELVLSNININVPNQSIYGFLGANGAGKTTSIRLILGLLKPASGNVFVFGEDIKKTHPHHFNKIGSLIENPSLYGHLSAEDNLRIWSKFFNTPKQRISEVLELVNLGDAKKKKTADFSTGMKQRLGLATALLHDPQLIILDEPTNGLDPMGIIKLREILNQLRSEGKTILLSSHILLEVEKLVTQIGIIKDGSIVFEGNLQQLQEIKQKNIEVILKVDEVEKAFEIIQIQKKSIEESIDKNRKIKITLDHENELPNIVKSLVNADVNIYEVSPIANDLEKMFLSITK